jgi:hypothetical protein
MLETIILAYRQLLNKGADWVFVLNEDTSIDPSLYLRVGSDWAKRFPELEF